MKRLAATLLLSTFVSSQLFASSAGTTTAEFMKFVSDPVAVAMGEGCTALAASPGMVLCNPAGLAGLNRSALSLAYISLPEGISYNFVGVGVPTQFGIVGISAIYLNYGYIQGYYDDFTAYDLSNPTDMSANITYAIPIRRFVPLQQELGSVGTNLKFIRSVLGDYSSETLAVDIGIDYKIPFIKGLTFGAVYKNIVGSMKYVSIITPLPASVNTGLSYTRESWRSLAATVDYAAPVQGNPVFSFGLSAKPAYFVTLRGGYVQEKDSLSSGMRAGVGFQFGAFSLNYAYSPFSEFSPTQHIGIDVAIGDFTKPESAADYYLQFHFDEAKTCFRQQDYIGCRQKLEEILGLYPDFSPAKEYLGLIDKALNDEWQRKQALLDKYFRRADSALARHDLVNAQKAYNSILNIDNTNPRAEAGLRNIDKEMQAVKQEEERKVNFRKIHEIWETAVKLFKDGRYVESEDKFKEILVIDPENEATKKYLTEITNQLATITANQITALFEMGVTFYKKGKYEMAQKYFEAVSISSPNRQDAKDYIVRCQDAAKEENDRAYNEKMSKQQDSIKAELDDAYKNGLSAFEKGNNFKALEWFTKTRDLAVKYKMNDIKIDTDKYIATCNNAISDYYYKEAYKLYQRNKFEDAFDNYRKALNHNSENTSARVERDRMADVLSQQYYEKGMDYYTKGDLEKARTNFRASINFKPNKEEAIRALERIK
jgi:tetratricopeptide (TPR) repeat protein